jgi:hypothetical protein
MLQSGAHLIFICRIPAGVVLSEIYTEYGSLFMALLNSLKSPMEHVFQPAVWALSELVSQVDVLPGREQAVTAIIKSMHRLAKNHLHIIICFARFIESKASWLF